MVIEWMWSFVFQSGEPYGRVLEEWAGRYICFECGLTTQGAPSPVCAKLCMERTGVRGEAWVLWLVYGFLTWERELYSSGCWDSSCEDGLDG